MPTSPFPVCLEVDVSLLRVGIPVIVTGRYPLRFLYFTLAPSARRESIRGVIGRFSAEGSHTRVVFPSAKAASAEPNLMTVPACPQSIVAPPRSLVAGLMVSDAGSPSKRNSAPSAIIAFAAR